MHYIILATLRILLAGLMLLGMGFLVLTGLLSVVRELLMDDHQREDTRKAVESSHEKRSATAVCVS